MLQSGDINQYKPLSQFRDLNDFNNHFEQHMLDLKVKFTKSELVALKRLVRFSASIAGVCFAKIQTVVAATHSQGIGISRSTFKRMLTKAKEMGLLVVHNTFKNGKQGHSVYVFNRYASSAEQSDNAKLRSLNSSISEQYEPLNEGEIEPANNYQSIKSSNKLNKRTNVIDSQFTSSRVPKEFTRLTSLFYDSAETIEELWKIVTVSTYHTPYDAQTVLNLALDSFRQLIRYVKKGSIRKSIYALYWGIVNKQLDQLHFEDLYEDGFAVG